MRRVPQKLHNEEQPEAPPKSGMRQGQDHGVPHLRPPLLLQAGTGHAHANEAQHAVPAQQVLTGTFKDSVDVAPNRMFFAISPTA